MKLSVILVISFEKPQVVSEALAAVFASRGRFRLRGHRRGQRRARGGRGAGALSRPAEGPAQRARTWASPGPTTAAWPRRQGEYLLFLNSDTTDLSRRPVPPRRFRRRPPAGRGGRPAGAEWRRQLPAFLRPARSRCFPNSGRRRSPPPRPGAHGPAEAEDPGGRLGQRLLPAHPPGVFSRRQGVRRGDLPLFRRQRTLRPPAENGARRYFFPRRRASSITAAPASAPCRPAPPWSTAAASCMFTTSTCPGGRSEP